MAVAIRTPNYTGIGPKTPNTPGGGKNPPHRRGPNRGPTGRRGRGPEAPRAAPPSQEEAARGRPQPDQEGAPPGDPDPGGEKEKRKGQQDRKLEPHQRYKHHHADS